MDIQTKKLILDNMTLSAFEVEGVSCKRLPLEQEIKLISSYDEHITQKELEEGLMMILVKPVKLSLEKQILILKGWCESSVELIQNEELKILFPKSEESKELDIYDDLFYFSFYFRCIRTFGFE